MKEDFENRKHYKLWRFFILLTLFLSTFNVHAQRDNLRLELDAGFPLFSNNDRLALFATLEPKLQTTESTWLGLRLAVVINSQTFEFPEGSQYSIDERFDYGFLSIAPSFEYIWDETKFSPFVGLGAGVYLLANSVEVFGYSSIASNEVTEIDIDFRPGAFAKGGFEVGQVRLALEYNFVPNTDLRLPTNEVIGGVKSSFVGISFGIIIGGKKS